MDGRQLTQDHPALRDPALADSSQASVGTQARAILQQRLILPILDGLDELPESLRALALHAINQALPARQPLVLSSRTAEYRSTLTTPAAVTVLLNGAAGIHLLPLDPTKAAAYLERDAGGPGTKAAARWRRVTASLGTTAPVSHALSTPLGLFLARTIYNPRPHEHLSDLLHLSDPDELLDQARFPTRQDIDTHLFTAFIPAAYRPHPEDPTPWSAQQAQHALTFLARHLQHTLRGTPNLAWWQLPEALSKHRRVLTIGLISGLMSGLSACTALGLLSLVPGEITFGSVFTFVVLAGLGYGFTCAVAATWVGWLSRTEQPSSHIRWSWRGGSWVTFGLVPGLVFGAALGIPNSGYGLRNGVVVGLSVGLPFLLLGGLRSVHPDLTRAVRPGAILAQDRRTYLVITVTGGLAGVLATTLVQAFEIWWKLSVEGVGASLVLSLSFGLALGLPIGFMLALARSIWMEYLVTRIRLAARGRVPWRFMTFLADAHERRGVLRQAGAVYQFRHLDLQRHLAQHQP
ncbi:hypothetical protein [Streptomyces sp. NPDC049590]|uniref:hypothetical protein n=1 Tax=Streptomyces sp. NPDC049590 TaxID=3154834 RepID=UPI003418C035